MTETSVDENTLSTHCLQFIQTAEDYLEHRKCLLALWNIQTYEGTSFDQAGKVLKYPDIDNVRRGNPPTFDPTLRQRNLNGDIILNLRQLYESAALVKVKLDSILKDIANAAKLKCDDWNGREEIPIHSGLLLCPLKPPERATDKIKDKYQKREPGPPESWLYDVVRAGFYCEAEDQMCEVIDLIQSNPNLEIIRLKNRFVKPTPAGYRDVLINVRVVTKSDAGKTVTFICEICISQVELRRYEIENGTPQNYDAMRPLFSGSTDDIDRKLEALERVVGATSQLVSPDWESEGATRNSQEEISKRLGEIVDSHEIRDDLQNLALWTKVLQVMGEFQIAEKVQRRLLKIQVPKFGEDHEDVADSLDMLAMLLRSQGKFPQALTLYEKAVYVRTRIFGEKSASVAQSLHNMAGVMFQQGKYLMATPAHEQVLLIRKKLYGEEHPDVAQSLNNLAGLYEAQGQLGEAKLLYRQSIDIWKKVYGNNHPYVASSSNNLAILLDTQDLVLESRPLYEEALNIRIALYGENHPTVAASLNNLALCLKKLGELEAARPLYERALSIRRQQYGNDHLTVATTLNNLGMLLKRQSKYVEARPLYEEALAIRQRLLGPDHIDVAASLNNLGLLLDTSGDYEAALPLHEEALNIRTNVFGEVHPTVADTLMNLGMLYKHQNKFDLARQAYERAYNIRVELLGDSHSDVKNVEQCISALAAAEAKTDSVMPSEHRVGVMRLRMYGSEHAKMAISVRTVALNLRRIGKHEEAFPLLEQSLALLRIFCGEEHTEVGEGMFYLALTCRSLGKITQSLALLEAAIRMQTVLLGRTHPKVLEMMMELANLMVQQRDYDTAKGIMSEIIGVCNELYGDEHEQVAAKYSALANIHKADGEYEEAKRLHDIALQMRIRLGGEDSTMVAESLNDLGSLMMAEDMFTQSETLYYNALSIHLKAHNTENHVDVATSYYNLGCLFREQLRWSEAKSNFDKSAQLYMKTVGVGTQLASALNELAMVIVQESDDIDALEHAVSLLEKALVIRKQFYGKYHPDTAQVMHNAAVVLRLYPSEAVCEQAIAILLFEEALEVREKIYHEEADHPDMVATLEELSSTLLELQEWESAVPIFIKLLDVRRREFPEGFSVELAQTVSEAALVYMRTGLFPQAKELCQAAINMRSLLHGEMSIEVADALCDFAELRDYEGKYNKSKALLEQALEIRRKEYGDEHSLVAEIYEGLAHMRRAVGRNEKARLALESGLMIRRIFAGEAPDPDVASDLYEMASILYEQERFDEAIAAADEALEMRLKLYGDGHMLVADCIVQQAEILCKIGNAGIAQDKLKTAIEIRKWWFGDDHTEVALAQRALGAILHQEGEHELARPIYEQALKTCQTIHKDTPHPDLAEAYNDVGVLLSSLGDFEGAVLHFRAALKMWQKLYTSRHMHVVNCLMNYGFALRQLGKLKQCRSQYEQATAILRDMQGDSHVDVALCLSALSSLSFFEGKYEDALILNKQVVNIRKKLRGADNELASTLINQVTILENLGRYGEGAAVVEKVLAWKEKNADHDSPEITDLLISIADLRRKQERYQEAFVANRRVMERFAASLGPLNMSTLERKAFEAEILKLQGHYREAEEILRSVVEDICSQIDRHDPEALPYIFKLAGVVKKVGRAEEAEGMYNELLDVQTVSNMRRTRATANILNNLGVTQIDLGNYGEAKTSFEESLKIRTELFGEEHADVASSYNNLAGLLELTGQYKRAKNTYQGAIEIRCKVYGSDHPSVAQSLINLAELQSCLGEWNDAQSLFNQAIVIFTKTHGPNHPDVAVAMNNLAGCREAQGMLEEARQLYQKSLEIRTTVYGGAHPLVAQSLNNLASVLHGQERYEEAGALFEETLKIKRNAYGYQHTDIAEALNNLAVVQRAQGQFHLAVSIHEEAAELYQTLLGLDHPFTMNVMGNLGVSYKKIGNNDGGDQLIRQTISGLSKRGFADGHPWMKKFRMELADNGDNRGGRLVASKPTGADSALPPRTLARDMSSLGYSSGTMFGSQRESMFHQAEGLNDSATGVNNTTGSSTAVTSSPNRGDPDTSAELQKPLSPNKMQGSGAGGVQERVSMLPVTEQNQKKVQYSSVAISVPKAQPKFSVFPVFSDAEEDQDLTIMSQGSDEFVASSAESTARNYGNLGFFADALTPHAIGSDDRDEEEMFRVSETASPPKFFDKAGSRSNSDHAVPVPTSSSSSGPRLPSPKRPSQSMFGTIPRNTNINTSMQQLSVLSPTSVPAPAPVNLNLGIGFDSDSSDSDSLISDSEETGALMSDSGSMTSSSVFTSTRTDTALVTPPPPLPPASSSQPPADLR